MATLDRQVAASADDGYAYWDGSSWTFNLDPNSQSSGYYSSTSYKRGGGMRFTNITIPKGSTITSAYLTLTASADASVNTVNTKLRGEDADNPGQFSDYSDYSGRTRTTNQVEWNSIPAWTKDSEYDSPDISSIIQEIIDREGWASGNALVIFWDDHDDLSTHTSNCRRNAYAYDQDPNEAAVLHLQYTPPAAGGARSCGCIIG